MQVETTESTTDTTTTREPKWHEETDFKSLPFMLVAVGLLGVCSLTGIIFTALFCPAVLGIHSYSTFS